MRRRLCFVAGGHCRHDALRALQHISCSAKRARCKSGPTIVEQTIALAADPTSPLQGRIASLAAIIAFSDCSCSLRLCHIRCRRSLGDMRLFLLTRELPKGLFRGAQTAITHSPERLSKIV